MNPLRLFETIHGHLAVLALAGLLHPAILLRKGHPLSWRNRLAVLLSTLAVVLAFGSGLFIYGDYVNTVKLGLFQRSTFAGLLFETKEHIAFALTTSSLGAGLCAVLAPRNARQLRQLAAVVFGISALLCLIVVVLGTYISSVKGFV